MPGHREEARPETPGRSNDTPQSPQLDYLHEYPVEAVRDSKKADEGFQIEFSNGAVVNVDSGSLPDHADLKDLALLTVVHSATETKLRFGQISIDGGGNRTITNVVTIPVDPLGYSISDPRFPDAPEFYPQRPVEAEESPADRIRRQYADRAADHPETPPKQSDSES